MGTRVLPKPQRFWRLALATAALSFFSGPPTGQKVARYNAYRQAMDLNPVDSFDQMTGDPIRQQALKELYGTPDAVGASGAWIQICACQQRSARRGASASSTSMPTPLR